MRRWSTAAIVLGLTSLIPALASAQDDEPEYGDSSAEAYGDAAEDDGEDDDNPYGEAGTFEIGGSLGAHWNSDLWGIEVSPQAGWFIVDYVELSAIFGLEYERVETEGNPVSGTNFTLVVEPSYHPQITEDLLLLAGLGLGVGYDGSYVGFDVIPRVGINVLVGRAGVVTPALSVPIVIGEEDAEEGVDVSAGMRFNVGYTTTF